TSTGVFESATLPGGSQPMVPPSTVQGSITNMEWQGLPPPDLLSIIANAEAAARQQHLTQIRSRDLPDSGLGLFAVGSSLIGACVGWKKAKNMRNL
ncbi:MAG: hypothetical protein Greene101449_769, partial [Candidatus Peregrinibacteria bacterium Greene1014_49]